jgi:hypothetical protein
MADVNDGDLAVRTRFMRITPATGEVLRAFWKIVEPALPAILDGFISTSPRNRVCDR